MSGWDKNSEWFSVGETIAPEGVASARKAIAAKLAGDHASTIRYARQTLDADRYANEERAAGRTARRSTVTGNAWSTWFNNITGQPSGW